MTEPNDLNELRLDRKLLIDAGFQNAEAVLATITRLREALAPFAKVATPDESGEPHTAPIYDLERQTGTGELRLYSPFSDARRELPMFTADFHRARQALGGEHG